MPIAGIYLLSFVAIAQGVERKANALVLIGVILLAAGVYFTAQVIAAKRRDELNRRKK